MRIPAIYRYIRDASFSEVLIADAPITHPLVAVPDLAQLEANQ